MYFVARESRPSPLLVASWETLEVAKVDEVNAGTRSRRRTLVVDEEEKNGSVFRRLERRRGDARDNFEARYAPRRIYGNPVDAFYRQ